VPEKQPAGFGVPAGFIMSLFLCIIADRHTGDSAAQVAWAAGVRYKEARAAAAAGALYTEAGVRAADAAVPVPALVLRKEAPNAVLRAETEVRRMRVRVVAEAGAYIEVSRHPARIGVSHRLKEPDF